MNDDRQCWLCAHEGGCLAPEECFPTPAPQPEQGELL